MLEVVLIPVFEYHQQAAVIVIQEAQSPPSNISLELQAAIDRHISSWCPDYEQPETEHAQR